MSTDAKAPAAPPRQEDFPPLGRMIAWLPSKDALLPPVTHSGHRKFRIHLHGFHCIDSANDESRRKTLMCPGDDERTANIFAYRSATKRWTKATVKEYQAFRRLEDSDAVILAALGHHPREAFSDKANWVKKTHCPHGHGDCLYAVIMAYVPIDMINGGTATEVKH